MRQLLTVTCLIVALLCEGCQSTRRDPGPAADPAGTANQPPRIDSPAAYIDSKPVTRDELYQAMVQAQGGQALSELLLDRAIGNQLAEQGITLTGTDIDAEREQLLTSLSNDRDQATRLLDAMREQRGLGDARFANLLKRNAGLRRLVRDNISVTDAAIEQAYDLRFGPRYRVRLITADNVATLSQARQRVIAGESFTDLAIGLSTDASAAQGGLLSPINTLDATYPKAVRDALPKLSTDERATRLSPVIALPDGYALLWLEDVTHKDAPPIEQVRAELERAVRIELERVRMQQLAKVLVERANVVVLDPGLDASWKRQRETILGQP